MLPEVIETKRLKLRPFRLGDVEDVMGYATDPEWGRFLPVPVPYTRKDAEKFIANQVLLNPERHQAWAIEHSKSVIGGINLGFDFENRLGTMGYGISRTHWGKGLTTEAAQAVLDAAFTAYPDLNKVRAAADPRNPASLRVMEKIGMVEEGVFRQHKVFRGEFVDEAWCGILRSEWENRKQLRSTPPRRRTNA